MISALFSISRTLSLFDLSTVPITHGVKFQPWPEFPLGVNILNNGPASAKGSFDVGIESTPTKVESIIFPRLSLLNSYLF